MNKYEIQIGEFFDVGTQTNRPRQTMCITTDQFEIIKIFASQRKDAELNTIYKINDCEFKVVPVFK